MDRPVAALPRITIITPCRNGARFIAEAVESVRRQHYANLEHIAFDACSTDTTLSVLRQYPEVTVFSELDEGSHDAMNRGLRKASGEVIGFLNVDDLYPDGLLNSVSSIFAADPHIDVVIGNAVMFENDRTGDRRVLSERTHDKRDGLWLPELTFGVPGINGWFFRSTVFERVGAFDNEYSFSADRRFLISVALMGLKARLLGKPGIYYRRHAGSRTINREMANLRPITSEHFRMALELSKRAGVNAYQRRVFLAWNAFEGTKLFVRDAMAGRIRDAANMVLDLTRRNPLWPIRVLHGIALRLAVMWLDRDAVSRVRGSNR